MKRIISFMHISLDGFVAGPKGEMDWIIINEEIFDCVGQRIRKTDTAMYGRVTYQMMESYWPGAADKPDASKHDIEHSAWYSKASKIVLSRTMDQDSQTAAGRTDVEVVSEDFISRISEIKRSPGGGGEEILLFGSPAATHSLIEANLIDGYWLFVNPIILGQGIPLFTEFNQRRNLELTHTRQFSSGVIELKYLGK